ncbi:MAG: hypothetical protein IJK89_07695 [Clostridia bacterium]|nr:hypothetical protein [Clostridia bacterium]
MLTKNDGMLAIVDMAISLAEFIVNFLGMIMSGDFSSLSDLKLDMSSITDIFGNLLG